MTGGTDAVRSDLFKRAVTSHRTRVFPRRARHDTLDHRAGCPHPLRRTHSLPVTVAASHEVPHRTPAKTLPSSRTCSHKTDLVPLDSDLTDVAAPSRSVSEQKRFTSAPRGRNSRIFPKVPMRIHPQKFGENSGIPTSSAAQRPELDASILPVILPAQKIPVTVE